MEFPLNSASKTPSVTCVFIGGPPSRDLLPASSYLHSVTFPEWVERHYLNHGSEVPDEMHGGKYFRLSNKQRLGTAGWSHYLRRYLRKVESSLVLLTLDDFLFGNKLNDRLLQQAVSFMQENPKALAVRCGLTPTVTRPLDLETQTKSWRRIRKEAHYRVSTQLTLWRTSYLQGILQVTTSPWNFELGGSRLATSVYRATRGLYGGVYCPEGPIAAYPEHSALSRRWGTRVNVFGLSRERIDHLVSLGLLDRQRLIWGFWPNAPSYDDFCADPARALRNCPARLRSEVDDYIHALSVWGASD